MGVLRRSGLEYLVEAFDVSFALRVPTVTDLESLLVSFPARWRISRLAVSTRCDFEASWVRFRGVEQVAIDGRLAIAARGFVDIGERMTSVLEAEVASRSSFTVLHAGVVVCDGLALMLPGGSFRGKSRLVAALVEAGAVYFSDDSAFVDRDARVLAVGSPMAIRRPDGSRHRRSARDLGWHSELPPAPISLVYFGRYRPRATFDPEAVATPDSILGLLQHTVSSSPHQFRTLVRVDRQARTVRSDRGEAAAVADSLLELLSRGGGRS